MNKNILKQIKKETVFLEYEKGVSEEEILRKFNISRRTYYNYLKDVRQYVKSNDKYIDSVNKLLEDKIFLIDEVIKQYNNAVCTTDKQKTLYLLQRSLDSLENTLEKLGIVPKLQKYKIVKELNKNVR